MSTQALNSALPPFNPQISVEEYNKFKTLNNQSKGAWIGIALCVGTLFGTALIAGGFFLTGPASYAALAIGGFLSLGVIPGIVLIVKNSCKPTAQVSLRSAIESEALDDLNAEKPIVSKYETLDDLDADKPVVSKVEDFADNVPIEKTSTESKDIYFNKEEAKAFLKKMLENPQEVSGEMLSENPHLFANAFTPDDFNYEDDLLHNITLKGTPLLLELFLELGDVVSEKMNQASERFLTTPLNLAIEAKNPIKIKILIKNGADPRIGTLSYSNPSAQYYSIVIGTRVIVSYFLREDLLDEATIIEILMGTGDISSDIYELLLENITSEISEEQLKSLFSGLFCFATDDIPDARKSQILKNLQLFYDKWENHPNFSELLEQEISSSDMPGVLNTQRAELYQLALYALIFSTSEANIKIVISESLAREVIDMFALKILFNHPNFFCLLTDEDSTLHSFITKEIENLGNKNVAIEYAKATSFMASSKAILEKIPAESLEEEKLAAVEEDNEDNIVINEDH